MPNIIISLSRSLEKNLFVFNVRKEEDLFVHSEEKTGFQHGREEENIHIDSAEADSRREKTDRQLPQMRHPAEADHRPDYRKSGRRHNKAGGHRKDDQ
jgi:hypothetical protein